MIKYYLNLIKPNIVLGNIMSVIGGFFIASKETINYLLFINMIIGISLIMAASCILNNVIDRDIDAIMKRTKNRILVINKSILFIKKSIFFAVTLSILGFLFLSFTKNFLVIYLTAVGVFIYIGIYSLWMKRTSIYSIIVGSLSGSMPPIVGYCTVTYTIDTGAILLLIMFILWQIPHSYAITILRLQDYKAVHIPTFPIIKGISITIKHMLISIIGFIITTIFFTIMGYTSYIFLLIINSINFFWLYIGINGYKQINTNIFIWAKKMLLFSIIVITSLNLLLSLDNIFIKFTSTYI